MDLNSLATAVDLVANLLSIFHFFISFFIL